MKTNEEIIKETAEFYTSKNRGYDKNTGGCVYRTEDNEKCALGRCISFDQIISFASKYVSSIMDIKDEFAEGETLDQYLKPEYRGHKLGFWADIQTLHDEECNWTKEGISESGQEYVDLLLESWTWEGKYTI